MFGCLRFVLLTGGREHVHGVQHGHQRSPHRRDQCEGGGQHVPCGEVHTVRGQLYHPSGRLQRADQPSEGYEHY